VSIAATAFTASARVAHPSRTDRRRALGLFVVLIATALSYAPNLTDYFSTDDFLILAPARRLPAGAFIWNTLILRGPVPFWRPLMAPIYVAETWLFGLHPMPYHLVNLGLHLLITCLLCRLVWALSGSSLAGIVAALFFGISPTYAGSVAWMATLNELTAITFYMLTLVLFVHAVQHRRNAWLFWAGSFLTFVLALLAWEAAITVVAILGFFALYARGIQQRRWPRFVVELAPFVLLAAAYCVFNWIAQVREANNRLLVYGFGAHILPHYWWYLGRLILPFQDNAGSWAAPLRSVGAWLLLIGCAVAAIRGTWAARLAVVWLLVGLAPFTLWIIWTGDRWTYTASLPLAMLLAMALVGAYHWVARRHLSVALYLAMAFFVLLPAVLLEAKVHQDQSLTRNALRWQVLMTTLQTDFPSLPAHSTVYLVDGTFTDLFDASYLQNIGQLLYGDAEIKDVDGASFYGRNLGNGKNVFALKYVDGHAYRLDPPGRTPTSAKATRP
jgi:hypothetical protein